MSVRAKEALDQLQPYKAAATIESVVRGYGYAREDIIKLEGNENRMGASPKIAGALARMSQEYSYYPDLNVTLLREKLAAMHGISGENLIFGNGSFELISLIANAYIGRGDEAISVTPSFNWYYNVTIMNEGIFCEVSTRDDLTIDVESVIDHVTDKTKVTFICNPNNPTGHLLPEDDLRYLVENTPDSVLLVIDEAYLDFHSSDYVDTVRLALSKSNVILLRTISKSYGLASFRVGYGIAFGEIISNMSKVKCPPNISMPAQVAAVTALEDREYLQKVLDNNRIGLQLYYEAFEALGFDYIKSSTNFVFAHTGLDANLLKEEFLKRAIMIRSGSDYGYNEWIRISVGTYEDNLRVVSALHEIVQDIKTREI